MNPEIYTILNASTSVKLLMGAPVRVYPWGRAPENVKKPYGVYMVYNANSENYLDKSPDMDNKGTQLNLYSDSAANLEECFTEVRDTIEPYAHMISFSTPALDDDTNFYSCTMEFDFWEAR